MRVFLVLCLWAGAVSAQEVRVVDGDTLDIGDQRYRIEGIDAPERGQRCQSKAGLTTCGKDALLHLEALIGDAAVRCEDGEDDKYGRIVARCWVGNVDLGAAMIAGGQAWAFTRYSDTYAADELEAKARGLGIWEADNMPAWDYRAERWAVAVQVAPNGCPIKGNISDNGRIYHPPWSPWYSRTRISPAKGERWFCIEAEALAAGWRAPRRR